MIRMPISPRFRARHRQCGRIGFSLAELLVVIGIIAVLAGVLIPVVYSAKKQAMATRMTLDLQAIATGLEAYHADFGDYPRLPPVSSRNSLIDKGPILLAWALVGPYPAVAPNGATGAQALLFDGADGPGFRIRPGGQGRKYEPYIPLDRIRIGTNSAGETVLLDQNGATILYFAGKATGKLNAGSSVATVGTTDASLYNSSDCTELPASSLQSAVSSGGFSGPFIVWSAGADGGFGTKDDVSNIPK